MAERQESGKISDEAIVAAANALLDAGFVDPDDGTIPQWHEENAPPWWTHPSEAVKVALSAALPHLIPSREQIAAAAHKYFCVLPDEPTHEPDEIDYDKADEILGILALLPNAASTEGAS